MTVHYCSLSVPWEVEMVKCYTCVAKHQLRLELASWAHAEIVNKKFNGMS